jgi:hypothetical protein
MFLLADDAAVAVVALAVVALLIVVSSGVVPVAISRSSLMVAKDPSTDSFAAARSELEVARDVFSASEQVTVEATEVIFVVRVVTVEFSGFAATMVLISVTMVMISAQLAAARAFLLELARLSTLVLAASRPAELAVSVLADASKSACEVARDDIAFIPSSSACLQAEKFPLQYFSCSSTATWVVWILHFLTVAASAVKLELLQQVQASVPFALIIWQVATIPLNVSIELTQADTSVMLGRGMFSVAHTALTLASQPLRRVARLVKFFAPLLVVEPWQLRAAELPPPDLMIRSQLPRFDDEQWSEELDQPGHSPQRLRGQGQGGVCY